MITRILILLLSFAFLSPMMQAATTLQNDINIRDISVGASASTNNLLEDFKGRE